LANLVDKSLVSFAGRYRLLETVRQYAAERLDERGETEDVRARHLDHFLRLAEAAEPHIFGGENDRVWIDLLEEENDNLRAAFDHCQAGERRAEAELRLVAALHWFWFARGHLREGRDRIASALRKRAGAPAAARARALAAAGFVALWIGDYAAMPAVLEEALAIARGLGDRKLCSYALSGIGAAAAVRGDAAAARPFLEEAVALAREQEDEVRLVFALYWLGTAQHAQRDVALARASLTEALAIARRHDNRPGIRHVLYVLGDLAQSEGDNAEARRHYLESLRTMEGSTDRWGLAMVLDALGRLAVVAGQPERGAHLLGATEALCELIGGSVLPGGRAYDDADTAYARAQRTLGEPAFAAAWAHGRTLTLAEAVAYAGSF
jgi:non-specific serine/threonine protein kinase